MNLNELKQRISLEQLFIRDHHKLNQFGELKKCLCPFHKEKTPSCCIYPDNHFFCFGCNTGGTVIDYVMKSRGLNFKDAVAALQGNIFPIARMPSVEQVQKVELPPPDFDEMIRRWIIFTTESRVEMMANKLNVPSVALIKLKMRWAPPHEAWAFPMQNAEGNTVGIRLRFEDGRKLSVKGSKEGLFYANPTWDTLFIVEGPTDAAAGLSMGLNVIGRPSCQGAVLETVNLIQRLGCREVVIISDNDAPGLAGSERLERALPVPFRELVLPCKDLRQFLKLGGTKALIESMLKSQLARRSPRK